MSAFYSEFDPHAAAWLRELIRDGLIPDGEVDERDIRQVTADDLRGYRSVHLFAGIGGWPLALRLAEWSDDRPVWTGSCPCQPYSAAGKGKGDADARNLWPEMFRLVRECRPQCVFGEQVEGAVKHGWLDRVSADLEAEGYAVGSAVLGAHSVGAPHIRQRLYWVADRESEGRVIPESAAVAARDHAAATPERGGGGMARGLADADGGLASDGGLQRGGQHGQRAEDGGTGERVGDATRNGVGRDAGTALGAEAEGEREWRGDGHGGVEPGRAGATGGVGDADGGGCERGRQHDTGRGEIDGAERDGATHWSDSRLVYCRDGKHRRVPTEPGLFPLAPGLPGRVALLRGAGNAICPQTAAAFIQAYLDLNSHGD